MSPSQWSIFTSAPKLLNFSQKKSSTCLLPQCHSQKWIFYYQCSQTKLKSKNPMISKWSNLRYVSMKFFVVYRYCVTHFAAFQWTILSAKHTNYVCNIRTCTNLSIQESPYYWCIRDVLHLFLLNFVPWALKQTKFITLNNEGIFSCTIFHAKSTKHFINICLLW